MRVESSGKPEVKQEIEGKMNEALIAGLPDDHSRAICRSTLMNMDVKGDGYVPLPTLRSKLVIVLERGMSSL